jgi:outer membrane autotransporter protein
MTMMITSGFLRILRVAVFGLPMLAAVVPANAQAPTGPLINAVRATPGVTPGQLNTATAVQILCKSLTGAAGSLDKPPQVPTPQVADLTNRCSELVTASRPVQAAGSKALVADISQIAGVQTTSQGALATQVPAGQFSNIGARISALRFGTARIAGRGSLVSSLTPVYDTFHVADENAGGFYTRDGGEALLRRASMMESGSGATSDSPGAATQRPAVPNPWGFFVEGGYGWGNREQTNTDDNGFKFDSFSVTGGLDYNFGDAVVGASVGFDRYKADFAGQNILADGSVAPGGESKVDGVSGSFFGAWFGEQWSFNGIASFGNLRSDLTRSVKYTSALGSGSCVSTSGVNLSPCGADQTLSGSPHGSYKAVGATVAYDAKAGMWTLTPSASLNYRHVQIDPYDESNSQPNGGLALSYQQQTIESFRSILGVNVSRPFSEKFGVLTPSFKAEWNHEFRTGVRTLTMKFVNDPYAGCTYCFNVPAEAPEANFGIVGAGLSALFAQRMQAYVYYERLVGVSYLKSNAISFGFRGQF